MQHQLRPRQPDSALLDDSRRLTTNAIVIATPEGRVQSDPHPLFSGDALQPDYYPPLNAMHGLVLSDEPNIDQVLPLSMASDLSLPFADSDMMIGAPSHGAKLCHVTNEARPISALSAWDFFDAPTMTPTPLSMFNSSDSSESMNTTILGGYTPQHLLSEEPVDMPPRPSDPMQPSSCFTQDLTSYTLADLECTQDRLAGVCTKQTLGVQDLISSVSKFMSRNLISTCFPPSLPDPYIQTLQCPQTATLLAYFHNAVCIGMDLEYLLQIHKSPFHNKNATMSDNPQALLAAARKPWIPANLQPTLPQILIPHHPYLDLLPFPGLRSKAIMLAAMGPGMFDPMELKKDIFREGLFCFAGGSGEAGKQPWDTRSWEAAPWFLKKWRLLFG